MATLAAKSKEKNNKAATRREKCNIIPIISMLCVLVSSMNIFLMANIMVLENHGQNRVQEGDAANQLKIQAQSQQQHDLLAKIQSPLRQEQKNPSNFRSVKEHHVNNPKPELPTTELQHEHWTSPHLVDCRKLVKSLAKEEETGMFMPVQIQCPSTATTASINCQHKHSQLQFFMNIHNPLKDSVSYKIFKEGCFECDHLAKLLDALSKYPDAYLLDIGGNIGMWSLVAAAANRRTFTIEPFAANYQRVCKSVDRNSFHDLIHVLNIAATSQNATFRIEVPERNKGGGRVEAVDVKSESGADFIIHDDTMVKGVTIDSLNLPTDRPIAMKLDVEGHELQALVGGMSFLQKVDIVYAMTELRPTFQKDEQTYSSWKRIVGLLVSKGLTPYRIDYENETKLDVSRLRDWRHVKHPVVRYFDVVWRKDV